LIRAEKTTNIQNPIRFTNDICRFGTNRSKNRKVDQNKIKLTFLFSLLNSVYLQSTGRSNIYLKSAIEAKINSNKDFKPL